MAAARQIPHQKIDGTGEQLRGLVPSVGPDHHPRAHTVRGKPLHPLLEVTDIQETLSKTDLVLLIGQSVLYTSAHVPTME